MYGQQYHETKSTNQLQVGVATQQTVLGEIAQRLSSASVRIGDVNARLKDFNSRIVGNSPEAVDAPANKPTAHSLGFEIQGTFEVLERRLAELEQRVFELNKIA